MLNRVNSLGITVNVTTSVVNGRTRYKDVVSTITDVSVFIIEAVLVVREVMPHGTVLCVVCIRAAILLLNARVGARCVSVLARLDRHLVTNGLRNKLCTPRVNDDDIDTNIVFIASIVRTIVNWFMFSFDFTLSLLGLYV